MEPRLDTACADRTIDGIYRTPVAVKLWSESAHIDLNHVIMYMVLQFC